jgi:glycosyltransferase involved in cell wall biosynthesis
MKILFTVFEMLDWGGIVQDLEWKARGLVEAGHTVDLIYLKNADMDPKMRGNTTREGSYPSYFKGATCNTLAGYFGVPVISYGSKDRLRKWYKRASKYDLIIHEIPGPNPAKPGQVDTKNYWQKLYDHDTPQIISAHDANYRDLYPYLVHLAPKIKGISCTNQAGYAGLSWFPAPRAFIGAPHPVLDWTKQKSWDDRKVQAVCAHVWKAWKHMDQVVRAIPKLKETNMVMCGSGIEYHYMSSVDKCKPKYEGIWQKAMDAGMDYRGMMPTADLQKLYRQSRVMVDMAWSKKFMKLGCHFNRSIIEGYNNGCVPIVVSENMIEDGFQVRMFKEGKTHFEIKADHRPKELAQLIEHVANLPAAEADEIVRRGRKVLLKYFDYRVSSLDYIKLAEGKPAGVYPKLETGKLNKKILAAADKFMEVKVTRMKEKDKARGK